MIKISMLKAQMAKKEKTGIDIARELNIAPNTFYRKLKRGVLGTDEVTEIIKYLDISKEDAINIFFTE